MNNVSTTPPKQFLIALALFLTSCGGEISPALAPKAFEKSTAISSPLLPSISNSQPSSPTIFAGPTRDYQITRSGYGAYNVANKSSPGIVQSVYAGTSSTRVTFSDLSFAIYGGISKSYTIAHIANGPTSVTQKSATSSPTTTDLMTDVDRIVFADQVVAMDVDGNAGKAFRMYQAAFDRSPDPAGLGFWLSAVDHGVSLTDIANGFMNSPEFKTLYGVKPSNREFVTRLYQNVLHRAPEDAGLNYWMSKLDDRSLLASEVLAGFSESDENKTAVKKAVENGIVYFPRSDFVPGAIRSVSDFGAVGDGVTDDAQAIQRAIISLPPDGGTILVPAGTYMLGTSAGNNSAGPGDQAFPNGIPIESALLITNRNVTLIGVGDATVLKLLPQKKLRMLTISKADNVTIQNIVFDGNKSARNTGVTWPFGNVVDGLVYGNRTKNLTFSEVEARDGIEDGLGAWLSINTVVINCVSHDNGTATVGATGVSLSGGMGMLINSSVSGNSSTGVWMAYGAKNTVARSNRIFNNLGAGITMGGLTSDLGSGDNRDFEIVGNIIEGNGSLGFAGVDILAAIGGALRDNQITNNHFAGIKFENELQTIGNPPSTGWVLTNNFIGNTDGFRLQSPGISMDGNSEASIKANVVRDKGNSLGDQIVRTSKVVINTGYETDNVISFSNPSILEDKVPPRGNLELPVQNSVISGSTVLIAGWAFDSVAFDRVEIYVDDIKIGQAKLGFTRTDVSRAIAGAPTNSGFEYMLNSNLIANGKHLISVRAYDKAQNLTQFNINVIVSN